MKTHAKCTGSGESTSKSELAILIVCCYHTTKLETATAICWPPDVAQEIPEGNSSNVEMS